jgi:hypothetical protein
VDLFVGENTNKGIKYQSGKLAGENSNKEMENQLTC